ncbi:hypothetical protein Q75_01570 [Bacillus coahuilensis p1.1.43]|uniref:Uncharacterized protein n=1 Tax=Bacillus coahuilensis p1.1.43 TaxID=1150625 RepID=A0A147KC49_9BACI|nr:hypothetical protein [Bacillus coahuilensis]KUP09019.1 hypothetical protein Q75_01570 [Bacillus coahuilensis p1.1.43]
MDLFFYITIIIGLTLLFVYVLIEKVLTYELKKKELELEFNKLEMEKLRLKEEEKENRTEELDYLVANKQPILFSKTRG